MDRHKDGQLLYFHVYDDFDKAGLSLKSTTILQDEVKRSYDLMKRPFAVESRLFKQNEVNYDPAGRLRRCRTQDPIGSYHVKLEYDDNDHLIMEEGHRTHVYACDSLHNRLSKNHVSHASNGLHQLIHNGEWTYRYDDAGNLKAKEKENETTLYRYDALDRLIAVETAGKEIHYTYDPFNRRVAKILNGQTTSFLYAGQNEIGSVNASGHIEELRVLGQSHGAEIGASIALELHGQIFAPSHDFQGNIVSLADAAGNPKETYRYTSFGEPTIYNGEGQEICSSLNPWRFSGKRADEETGFVYFGRRYYDPVNGRWITADPSGLDDGPNLYAYLHHSPLQAFDFYGLEEEPYYPLRNVDFHDKSPHPSQEKKEPSSEQEAPLGFVEKKKTKSDRMFFCGLQQIGDLGISCVNGIMNNLKDANANARALSEMADDHYVTFVHNQSKGLIPDLIRCFFELYFYMNTEAVKNLQARWDAHFLHAGPGSFLYHECHSEGAIITRNALMRYPEELRQRIIVVAIAPGAYIDDKYAHSVTHYRSTADIVPLFDFVGALRCRDTTVVLKPHHDASFLDHSISSPTYQDVREFKVDRYKEQYGGIACG